MEDVLGPAYTARTIVLTPDDEGEVVATLVSRPAPTSTGRAVLYVHGYVDYFFQDHLAQFWVGEGYDFYALDLRKYGRSLRPHQTPNFCLDLAEYDEELDEAVRIIRDEDGHDRLVVMAHSFGGLVTAVWLDRQPGVADALVLNSPWFGDPDRPWLLRTAGPPVINLLGARQPRAIIPQKSIPANHSRSVHDGGWDINTAWKPLTGFPVLAGPIRAVLHAQARLAKGLNVGCPALVACSTRTVSAKRWSDDLLRADSMLIVEHIVQRAPLLGRHVTIVRIPDGMHDLTLSAKEPRERFFAEVHRWCRAFVPE